MKKSKKLETELHALKSFIEAGFRELKDELRKAIGAGPQAAKPGASRVRTSSHHQPLLHALKLNKKSKELVRAGKQPDQLLRSLIPLYVARELNGVEVNSGVISAFWKAQGVRYAGPNAAKALRSHVGFAAPSKSGRGWVISVNGTKYVEQAIGARAAA